FWEVRFEYVARFGLLYSPLEAFPGLIVLDRWKNGLQVQSSVPDIQSTHLGEFDHPLPIASNTAQSSLAGFGLAETVAAAGNQKACCQPLDIPFPRCRERFVEIVNVEDHPSLRCGKRPKVHQMRVTTGLDPNPCCRRVSQVCCHNRGRAAVEHKGRGNHSS